MILKKKIALNNIKLIKKIKIIKKFKLNKNIRNKMINSKINHKILK